MELGYLIKKEIVPIGVKIKKNCIESLKVMLERWGVEFKFKNDEVVDVLIKNPTQEWEYFSEFMMYLCKTISEGYFEIRNEKDSCEWITFVGKKFVCLYDPHTNRKFVEYNLNKNEKFLDKLFV